MQLNDIDFIIIGAAKSATTRLQTQLQSDPAVYMPDPELHYFSREYDRGQDWYLSHFTEEGLGRTVGEGRVEVLSGLSAGDEILLSQGEAPQ